MKKVFVLIAMLMCVSVLSAYSNNDEESKKEIIVYGDYKCPYCKQFEEEVMPKIQKKYIETGRADFKFVNLAFLGKDSIKGSRAGHAVQNIAPSKYLEFQKNIFSKQPNNENPWITNKLLDNQINRLDISESKKDKIKKDYKTKNSQSWKDAERDIEIGKENNVKMVPAVYIDNEKIKDIHDINEYEKMLDER